MPKKPLRNHDSKIFLLDFFGTPQLKIGGGHFAAFGSQKAPLKVPAHRVLTAYGSPWNTFLGYYMPEGPEGATSTTTTAAATTVGTASSHSSHSDGGTVKRMQGVLWGKDPKHFDGKVRMLNSIANNLPTGASLVSVATRAVFTHPNVQWKGHQSRKQWLELLQQSKFLLGLGNPLMGPSAIDAIAAGCMFINPVYKRPIKGYFNQHPYASDKIGAPYVCSYPEGDTVALETCVQKALKSDLPPFLPRDFSREVYLQRLQEVFLSG